MEGEHRMGGTEDKHLIEEEHRTIHTKDHHMDIHMSTKEGMDK